MLSLPKKVQDLLEFYKASLRVISREGKHREFKRAFEKTNFSQYTKSLAAFANTNGGVLVFGVSDKPRLIVGVDAVSIPDEASWTDRLRTDFDPEINFEIREYEVKGKMLVSILAMASPQRPVICRRDISVLESKERQRPVLRQGTIYYRYAGQTLPIRYTELMRLLHDRDERRIKAFMDSVNIIAKIGAENARIVDASQRNFQGTEPKLFISSKIAKPLKFVEPTQIGNTGQTDSVYAIAGTVHLDASPGKLLDEEDQNLSTEAAAQIKPVVDEIIGFDSPFKAHHLTKLASHLGIRKKDRTDPRYCVAMPEINRYFYTRNGIEFINAKLREDPLGTISSFASKATIERYKQTQGLT